jgi:hypothetical protein
MKCPKCAAECAEGRDECATCGIVFERWRLAQESRTLRPTAPLPVEPERTIPRWVVIVALLFIVVTGTMWTKHRRDARAARNLRSEGMDMLNDINRKAVKQQNRRAQELANLDRREAARQAAADRNREAVAWPEGFNERVARSVLERCTEFSAMTDVKLPKRVPRQTYDWTLEEHPALARALKAGFVEVVDSDEYSQRDVRVTPVGLMQMSHYDNGTEYVVRLGRRRVTEVSLVSADYDRAVFLYAWEREERAASTLIPLIHEPKGRVEVVRNGGRWRVVEATGSGAESDRKMCTDGSGVL